MIKLINLLIVFLKVSNEHHLRLNSAKSDTIAFGSGSQGIRCRNSFTILCVIRNSVMSLELNYVLLIRKTYAALKIIVFRFLR